MVQTGTFNKLLGSSTSEFRTFANYAELHKFCSTRNGAKRFNEYLMQHTQLSTGAAVEVEKNITIGPATVAISQIGKAQVTVVCKGAGAEKLGDNGKIVVLSYVDATMTAHSATVTIAADFHDTEKAFVPAVADFYAATALTISASSANDLTVAVAGGAPLFGTITAGATAATPIQLLGVGAVYGRAHTDNADTHGSILTMDYINPIGTLIEGATCTLVDANGDDEIRFKKSDGVNYVSDFYRVRRLVSNLAGTANNKGYILTDISCANTNGAGGDVYAIIVEGAVDAIRSRFTAGLESYLGIIDLSFPLVDAGLSVVLYWTPYGSTVERSIAYDFLVESVKDFSMRLAPATDCYITIADNAAAANAKVCMTLIECT